MTFYYLDASAWVKRYYQELGTDQVHKLFTQGQTLVCSVLGMLEVWAALVRKGKARELSQTEVSEKLFGLEAEWRGFLKIQLSSGVIDGAKEVARNYSLRSADAIHLASALALSERSIGSNDKVVFVTSDKELLIATKAVKLAAINPAEIER